MERVSTWEAGSRTSDPTPHQRAKTNSKVLNWLRTLKKAEKKSDVVSGDGEEQKSANLHSVSSKGSTLEKEERLSMEAEESGEKNDSKLHSVSIHCRCFEARPVADGDS